jgi:hypothetical protein
MPDRKQSFVPSLPSSAAGHEPLDLAPRALGERLERLGGAGLERGADLDVNHRLRRLGEPGQVA